MVLQEKQLVNRSKPKFIGSKVFWCYVMIALPTIGFLVFQIYPILWTFKWSFYSYYGAESTARFIGWDNFKTFFTQDFTYWKAWGNTLLFAIAKIPVEMIISMLVALALNRQLKGSGFFRSMYFLPTIVSVAIVGLILSNMFSYNGFINHLLMQLGVIHENIDWFADKFHAMIMIVSGSVWSTFGTNVLYILSALSNVPEDLYESARIDGAGSVRQFFNITLPMILPTFQVILLLSIVGTLSINEYIIVLTNGGPYGATHSVMSYLYTKFVPGFAEGDVQLGYGCALSLVTTFIFAAVAIVYNKLSNKMKTIY